MFAVNEPTDCKTKTKAAHIANIYSRGPAVKSLFGDKNVMFSHNNMAEDIALKPQWADSVPYSDTLGLSDYKNDQEIYAKFGDKATAGCPYLKAMALLQ